MGKQTRQSNATGPLNRNFAPLADASFQNSGGQWAKKRYSTRVHPRKAHSQLGLHKSALSSPDFRQPQARQDHLRLPNTQLDSRRLGLEVVDNHAQLVIARRDINWKIKLDQGVDRFIR